MKEIHHGPSPECAALGPLLPLAPHDLLNEDQTTILQAHLANCAACRAELATYDRIEVALRHVFAPAPGALPPFSREEIMRLLQHPAERVTSSTSPLAPLELPPQKRSRRSGSFLALVAALILVLLAVGIFRFPGLHPQSAGTGTPVPSQITYGDLSSFVLNSISMVSPDEGWAVGGTQIPPTAASPGLPEYGDPVILHYSQGQWRPVPLPAGLPCHPSCHIVLHSIAMVSPTDGWAVGNSVLPPNADGVTSGIVLHYTGGRWVLDSVRDSALFRVFMRSANDGWMIGEGSAPVFHYTGSMWTAVNAFALKQISPRSIVALSATSVWLDGTDVSGSGFDGDAPEVILHYTGSQWTREQMDLANSRLSNLAMLSPTEGWAVGCLSGGFGPHPAHPEKALVEQYTQGRWQQAASFAGPSGAYPYCLYGLSLVSVDEGWAVGSNGLIVHELYGVWTRPASPTGQTLNSLVMLSPTEGWAVGEQGTILHYVHGSWNLYRD